MHEWVLFMGRTWRYISMSLNPKFQLHGGGGGDRSTPGRDTGTGHHSGPPENFYFSCMI